MTNRIVSNLSGGDLSLLLVETTPGVFSLAVSGAGDEGALITLDYVHRKIHDGQMFHTAAYYSSVANNAYADLLVIVGAKDLHVSSVVSTIGDALITRYRNPVVSNNGTLLTYCNINDSYDLYVHALTKFYQGPTVVSAGSQMDGTIYVAGGTTGITRTANTIRGNTERVYTKNTTYLYRIQNISGGATKTGYEAEYYEE